MRAAIAIGTLGSALSAALAFAPVERLESVSWALQMDFRGQSYTLDHGLTLTDCLDALPRNDVRHGLSFSCDKER